MPNCPNCGQATQRTSDWACRWCGYPLLSGSFKEILKTFAQLHEEKVTRHDSATMESTSQQRVKEPEQTTPEPEEKPASELREKFREVKKPEDIQLQGEKKTAPELKAKFKEVKQDAEQKAPESIPSVKVDSEPVLITKLKEKPSDSVLETTVEELYQAFKLDLENANAQLANKIIRVTGIVGRIAVDDIIDKPCVILTSEDKTMLRNVLCVFEKEQVPELNRLHTGQTITVQGRYDSCTINILMVDCTLAN